MLDLLGIIAINAVLTAIWFGVAYLVWTGRWPRKETPRLGLGIALGWFALAAIALLGGDGTLFLILGLVGIAGTATLLFKILKKPTQDQMMAFFYVAFIAVFILAMAAAKA